MKPQKIVRMADFKVAKNEYLLVTVGLGSCVGVTLYSPRTKVGGLAHIMLPDSSKARLNNVNGNGREYMAKYADASIELMIDEIKNLGAGRSKLVAKIAGGAHMFQCNDNGDLNIGDENVLAVKNKLDDLRIEIIAEDTGEDYGRTLEFDLGTGILVVKSARKGIINL
ncbi:MAG: chemotaxis protein CheD [ANME-2 cluster archaeon]|jgi:chemotaxis protein CheD|nr:chemotaxis protein CheD [ANME-2 cluster archaeon]